MSQSTFNIGQKHDIMRALHGTLPPGVSPALYNEDLAPTKKDGRTWDTYNIFALWANDTHSLGNYAFGLGLFTLGLGAWQILLVMALSGFFLFLLLSLSGYMGIKTGVPFPVMCRISFGIRGAQIPSLVRGGVAIVWFGIQTYLASMVLDVLLIAIMPGLADLAKHDLLGLSELGWISFSILWVIQVIIACYGMESIRRYEALSGPVILVTFVALAGWVLFRSGGVLQLYPPHALTGWNMWLQILGCASLWVAAYGAFVLNFCDFTRGAISRRAISVGNFWGIPINMLFFGAMVIVLAGGQFSINGQLIGSPTDVVHSIPNTPLLILASLSLLVLTVAVNLMANFVAPAYALANMLPKYLDFRRASIVSAVIGFVILPWNLYDSPFVILYFLGGLGALLGPLFGIIMVDYWLIRRERVDVPGLYTEDQSGPYYYLNGVNPKAIWALIPSAGISLLFAFLPALTTLSHFSWFVAAAFGGAFYYAIASKGERYVDRDGEAIVVDHRH